MVGIYRRQRRLYTRINELLLHCNIPFLPHFEFGTGWSLLFIFITIAVSILLSVVKQRK